MLAVLLGDSASSKMLRSRTLIAAALVIYGLSIDHQRCHAIEKIRSK